MARIRVTLDIDEVITSSTNKSFRDQKVAIKSLYDTKDDLRFINRHNQIHIIGSDNSKYYIKKMGINIPVYCVNDVDTFERYLFIGNLKSAFLHDRFGRDYSMLSTDVQTEHDMFTLSTLHDYRDLTFEDLKMCNELYNIFERLWIDDDDQTYY